MTSQCRDMGARSQCAGRVSFSVTVVWEAVDERHVDVAMNASVWAAEASSRRHACVAYGASTATWSSARQGCSRRLWRSAVADRRNGAKARRINAITAARAARRRADARLPAMARACEENGRTCFLVAAAPGHPPHLAAGHHRLRVRLAQWLQRQGLGRCRHQEGTERATYRHCSNCTVIFLIDL
jgi:hypothetical protein